MPLGSSQPTSDVRQTSGKMSDNVYTIYIHHHVNAMPKEKIINFRIDAELKNRARKLAEADGRSLSNWIPLLIEKEVKRGRKKA